MNGINKVLVLYRDDEYALSWLIDLVNKNNNIKRINKVHECGYEKIIIWLNDNSIITILKCNDIESTYEYLRGHKYDSIYVDSSIKPTDDEYALLESIITPKMLRQLMKNILK